MKLELSILTLALALIYGIVKVYAPDFPLSEPVMLSFVVYVLTKLGVQIVEPQLRNLLAKKFAGFRRE